MATISTGKATHFKTFREQADGLCTRQLESISKAYAIPPTSQEAHSRLLERMVTLAKSPEGEALGNRMALILARARARAVQAGIQAE